MSDFRLHLAELIDEPIKTQAADIQEALDDWRAINSSPRHWASLEMAQFDSIRIINLNVGAIHSDGTKEQAQVTISYSIDQNNKVYRSEHVHI